MNAVSTLFGFLPQVGPTELIIILVIAVIILGPKRIPAAAKSVGKGFRNFRDTVGSGDKDDDGKKQVSASADDGPEKTETHEKTKTGS